MDSEKTKINATAHNSSAANCYVIIRDMSAGNESIGEMWQETKIFSGGATLDEVMKWALAEGNHPIDLPISYSRKRVTITRPHND